MADIKRDAEREELFRTIYKIATDLVHAGHVSEWDFKSYVVGFLAANCFDVLRVCQNDLAISFKDIVNRNPILSGRFHTNILAVV